MRKANPYRVQFMIYPERKLLAELKNHARARSLEEGKTVSASQAIIDLAREGLEKLTQEV